MEFVLSLWRNVDFPALSRPRRRMDPFFWVRPRVSRSFVKNSWRYVIIAFILFVAVAVAVPATGSKLV